jgi:hypothetical protein
VAHHQLADKQVVWGPSTGLELAQLPVGRPTAKYSRVAKTDLWRTGVLETANQVQIKAHLHQPRFQSSQKKTTTTAQSTRSWVWETGTLGDLVAGSLGDLAGNLGNLVVAGSLGDLAVNFGDLQGSLGDLVVAGNLRGVAGSLGDLAAGSFLGDLAGSLGDLAGSLLGDLAGSFRARRPLLFQLPDGCVSFFVLRHTYAARSCVATPLRCTAQLSATSLTTPAVATPPAHERSLNSPRVAARAPPYHHYATPLTRGTRA